MLFRNFRVWLAGKDANGNNRYQYFWYAKKEVLCSPETGGETKTDSLNFGHISVTAQFVQTQYVPQDRKAEQFVLIS